MKIAALDGGTSYHYVALHQPPFNQFIDQTIYLPELSAADLSDVDVLIVTCRSHPKWLRRNVDKFADFLQQGKTLLIMGETEPQTWMPGIEQEPVAINYWWWLDPEAEFDLETVNPQHSIWKYLSLDDMTWHYHGLMNPPASATSLLAHKETGQSVLWMDESFHGGRVMVTSLDPFFHHGSHFMPATTRFLHGLFHWLQVEG